MQGRLRPQQGSDRVGVAWWHNMSDGAESGDQTTQLAAASSEQTSSAAEELAAQSQELAALVGKFELGSAALSSSPNRRRHGSA